MKIGVNTTGVFPTVGEASKEPGTALAVRNADQLQEVPTKTLLEMMEQKDQLGRYVYEKVMLEWELYSRLYRGLDTRMSEDEKERFLGILREVGGPIWMSQDKRAIPISKMDESHLLNIINKIARKENWRVDWLPVLVKELERRSKDAGALMMLMADPVKVQEMINWGR